MRRHVGLLLGLLIAFVLLVASAVAVHREGVDASTLQSLGLIEPGKTFSRQATDRPCPGLATGQPPTPTIPAGPRLAPLGPVPPQPTSVALLDDGTGFLGHREGQVTRIEDGRPTGEVVLDLSADTVKKGDGGLLALAVDPAQEWLYVVHTTEALDDILTAFPLGPDGSVDEDGARVIVRSGHPESIQHHGGSLAFDDAGRLYIGFGDGGGLGDPRENGQRLTTVLGKVLRIVPTPAAGEPYEVPEDNPFVGQDDVRPEIWAYGVRNPFRLSYDAASSTIWLGDVGQSCWEEINRLPVDEAGGSNLGWDVREGLHDFEPGELAEPVVDPVWEISHRKGWCAIVVGPVVQAPELVTLDGRLLVSDYCAGDLWTIDPDDPTDVLDTGLHVDNVIAIVPGPNGLPWVLTLEEGAFELQPA